MEQSSLPALVGQAPAFVELLERVSRVAPLDRPVLIVGERGTGKELIAARLHFLSRRWNRPFFKLNCGALVESLLESELFGHEAGAFTGAVRRRHGRFEAADHGTLFLDEIAEANLAAQEKLLRAVEYGEFERVGGNATVRVDVRLIGATNVDLRARAEMGRFRADLLDRLSFDVLTLPPLRTRPDDIPLLADHFGRAMSHELGWTTFPGFAETALGLLTGHDWPGNVRELKNVVERAVYRAERPERKIAEVVIDPFESPFRPAAEFAPSPSGEGERRGGDPVPFGARVDFTRSVARFERRLLIQALAATRHNQRAAATQLKLTYNQFRHLLRTHGLLPAGRGSGATVTR
ncbi:MAG: phage shock protein operon transcriptional activator [Alphaproteobacteria bacterium]|nr:phage shock protein operon transcriptional activator [Alphaproteobacteria bacterium]